MRRCFTIASGARRPCNLTDGLFEPQTTTPINKVINRTSNIHEPLTCQSHNNQLPVFCASKVRETRHWRGNTKNLAAETFP